MRYAPAQHIVLDIIEISITHDGKMKDKTIPVIRGGEIVSSKLAEPKDTQEQSGTARVDPEQTARPIMGIRLDHSESSVPDVRSIRAYLALRN